jgi:hypothetical protein
MAAPTVAVPHWEKQEVIPATGHDLSNIVSYSANAWSLTKAEATNFNKNTDDITFTIHQACKNPGCSGQDRVYHYVAGTNAYDADDVYHVYSSITAVLQDKGSDCQTQAKNIFTVNGLEDTIGKPVTLESNGKGELTVGDHKYEVTNWNWSKDYKVATVTAKCTVEGCGKTDLSQNAKVTRKTEANGITTCTATYGDQTDSVQIYTLDGAKVTFDGSTIVDANYVYDYGWYDEDDKVWYLTTPCSDDDGAVTAIQNAPNVTVTLNGTVLDPSVYDLMWVLTPVNTGTGTARAIYVWAEFTSAITDKQKTIEVVAPVYKISTPAYICNWRSSRT